MLIANEFLDSMYNGDHIEAHPANTTTELEILLTEVSALHTASMDESLPEEVTDELYGQFYDRARQAATLIARMADIDDRTALRMVIHRRTDIANLIALCNSGHRNLVVPALAHI